MLSPALMSLTTCPGLEAVRMRACVLSHLSCVQLFVTIWTVAHPTPRSVRFSRLERVAGEGYWRGLPFPPPGDLPPDPGMEPMSLKSPVLRGGLFTTCATWEAPEAIRKNVKTGRDLKRFFIWSHLLIHPRGPERVSQLVSRAAGTRYQ